MKKAIISNTLTFLMIVLFVNIFSTIFGSENSIVGVSIIIIALTLLQKDLTQNIFKKSFYIILLNVTLGLCAYLATLNPYIGLIINLALVFGIIYNTFENYKTPMYFPFILGYLFMMLAGPTTTQGLPKRLLALVVGSLFIILIQVVFNKKRFENTIKLKRLVIVHKLINKIDGILENKENDKKDKQLRKDIYDLVKVIYDKRDNNNGVLETGKINLNIALLLERLELVIDTIGREDKPQDYKELLLSIKKHLQNLEDTFMGKKVQVSEIKMENQSDNAIENEILDIVKNIKLNLRKLKEENVDNNKKHEFLIKNIFKKIDVKTFKFKFAFKTSVMIALAIFITEIFHFTYGKWIAYTVLALVQPYYEDSKLKTKHRIVGTVMGAILVSILFTVFKGSTMRTAIVLLAGYLDGFTRRYDEKMTVVTVQAIGAAVLAGGESVLVFDRIFFIAIGVIIALIANKYMFKYSLQDGFEELLVDYKKCISKIGKLSKENEMKNNNEVYNLILKANLIENKIIDNNNKISDEFKERLQEVKSQGYNYLSITKV